MGYPIIGDDLYHNAAGIPILSTRLKAIQSLSVGKIKKLSISTDSNVMSIADNNMKNSSNKFDENNEEDLSDDYESIEFDSLKYPDLSNTHSATIEDQEELLTEVNTYLLPPVRRSVGIFLECVGLSFFLPSSTTNNIKDVDTNDGMNTTRISVTCEMNPKFEKLLAKARKGYEWKLNQ